MAKSIEELKNMINNELVDSTSQKITGASVKNVILEMVETMAESAGSGGGQLKYYRLEPESDASEFLYALSSILKAHPTEDESQISIMTPVMFGTPMSLFTIVAAAVDLSLRIISQGQDMTIGEYIEFMLNMIGVESFEEVGAIEISKEEFYTI